MPRKYTVAVLPGDGIGPEVTDEAVRVLRACEEAVPGLRLDLETYGAGARYYVKSGKKGEWEPGGFEACQKADAILMGAIGLPGVANSDGRPVGGKVVLGIRMGLDLYANVRPVRLLDGVESPLRSKSSKDIDLVIVRENTEDLYAGIQGILARGGLEETGVDVRVITSKGSERVVRYSFNLASKRKGAPADGKKRVTCVDKSNVLRGDRLFRSVFDKVASFFPRVHRDYAYVDAMCQWMIRRPERYDVVVTTNVFGDILSELGASLQGGLGMAPSGNIGDFHAMFEPVHGSAPDMAGRNRANPVAAILSASMMLEWLGENRRDHRLETAAGLVDKAVRKTVSEGKVLTADLGGRASTRKVGGAIAKNLAVLAS
jgi:3-isopropylmalate dehydrogenase